MPRRARNDIDYRRLWFELKKSALADTNSGNQNKKLHAEEMLKDMERAEIGFQLKSCADEVALTMKQPLIKVAEKNGKPE